MAEVTKREQLIFDIATAEWDLFQEVRNTGGRASCQNDHNTFFRMRMSQWMVYSDAVLESYWNDLAVAVESGRNLIFEKYGRMMETTFPDEYEQIKGHLPEISKRQQEMVDQMAAYHVKWDGWMLEHYPNIRKNGRLLTTEEDNKFEGSSSESYLRGEALTYSENTVELMLRDMREADERGENLLKEIIANETAFYGYENLEAAEAAHGQM